jgi:hypothetical protein
MIPAGAAQGLAAVPSSLEPGPVAFNVFWRTSFSLLIAGID